MQNDNQSKSGSPMPSVEPGAAPLVDRPVVDAPTTPPATAVIPPDPASALEEPSLDEVEPTQNA